MKGSDRARVPANFWLDYLAGKRPGYPEEALRRDLDQVRRRVALMRADTSTPDTRLADDTFKVKPANVGSLIELMLGGISPGNSGGLLHCRLRYFDPLTRRAGLPEDVAVLVDQLEADSAAVTLVNIDQLQPRTLIIQAGGYAEHRFEAAELAGKSLPLNGSHCRVRLAPGAGARLVLKMKRYANPPTLKLPWDE
jgi:hypothetical protein